MTDDTRDRVIRLETEVQQLTKMVSALTKKLDDVLVQRFEERGIRRALVYVGLAVIAGAGGTGAVVAKLAGWLAVK